MVAVDSASEKLHQAYALFQKGQIEEAESLSRDLLRKDPNNVSALRLLAEIGIQVGVYEEAENLLLHCLDLAPDFTLARLNYAALLAKRTRYQESMLELKRLLESEPDNVAILVQKASVLVSLGDFDAAEKLYRNLTKRLPEHAHIQLSLGHVLKTKGDVAKAIDAYRAAIALEPAMGEAYWSLANLKTFTFTDADILQMKEQMLVEQPKAQDFVHLCFALGYALEKQGDVDGSFAAYAKGNQVKRHIVHYDARTHCQDMLRQKRFFSPAHYEKKGMEGCDDSAPIFIVGLPRAGSTLIEQILSSHSQVEGTMELPDIISMARRLSGKKVVTDKGNYPEILSTLSSEDIENLGEEYIERTKVHRSGLPFFIDKMPNNFMHIGFIKEILPKAKIIDARRHPMAGCFSCFKQLFAKGQNFTYSLNDIGNYYCDYYEIMEHWDTVLPQAVHRVYYEKMITDTEMEVRRLLDYCGLPFEEACLTFYQNDRAVRTASSEQVRQPIYQSGLEAWKPYEGHLAPLQKALAHVLPKYPAL
ncbi:sulfotransferase [Temperatibacter marinus]|uniref:Sulfotransferase n=1 Tax=Temperatibacter marinus TaxID=1456591 RepID=A0AA52HAR6_9PROT|nr:sulfotransferase [Temperatibacter marinus]WND03877.1 sulfotransferase [Temperatibacter marinus]